MSTMCSGELKSQVKCIQLFQLWSMLIFNILWCTINRSISDKYIFTFSKASATLKMKLRPSVRKISRIWKTIKSGNFAVNNVRNHCEAYMWASNPISIKWSNISANWSWKYTQYNNATKTSTLLKIKLVMYRIWHELSHRI